MTILEPVDIDDREALDRAVEHSSAATVGHLLAGEDVDREGRGHLEHVLHHVLVHLEHGQHGQHFQNKVISWVITPVQRRYQSMHHSSQFN